MARHILSARQVQVATDGDLGDGDGLLLRVLGGSASWVLRCTAPSGRRREFGLGAADRASIEAAGASLRRARKKAVEAREQLDEGIDPVDARRVRREVERAKEREAKASKKAEAITVRRFACAYHEKHVEPVCTTKHVAQWIASIEQHVPASILDAPLETVTAAGTSEALEAEGSEIDLQARIWTICAARMKAREQHVVYLSDRAVEIVRGQGGQYKRFVFLSAVLADSPMSNMACLMAIRRLDEASRTRAEREGWIPYPGGSMTNRVSLSTAQRSTSCSCGTTRLRESGLNSRLFRY